jgi:hypothetical protein
LSIENSTVLLGGIIRGDIEIPETSFLNTTTDNSTIFGNLYNRGILHVAENRILLVKGNFTQVDTGILNVDLVNSNQSAINITNATVTIAGNLQYKITKKPFLHSAKYPILGAENSVINGYFNNHTARALETSTVHRDLKVEIEGNIIYIIYDFSIDDVEPWEWVVIGVSASFLFIIAIICIAKFRVNREYQTIP